MLLAAAALATTLLAQAPALADAPQIGQVSKDSVWVPTPERVIRRMLQMADTTADDLVVDLGAGDGRIPIYAAKHFGAHAVGVELERNLVDMSIREAKRQGVSRLTRFVREDLFQADLSKATVLALYISPGVMERLKPKLLTLKPGTRVVSHYFTLGDWEPDESIRVENRSAHLWVVPAAVEGSWAVRIADDAFTMQLVRSYQKLASSGQRGGKPMHVIGAQLRGTEIRFSAFDRDGSSRHYSGRVDGDRMAGQSEGIGLEPRAWSAGRVPSH